jgi:hypothetical protein
MWYLILYGIKLIKPSILCISKQTIVKDAETSEILYTDMNGQIHALADLLLRKSPEHQMIRSRDSLDMMAKKNISNISTGFEPLTYRP